MESFFIVDISFFCHTSTTIQKYGIVVHLCNSTFAERCVWSCFLVMVNASSSFSKELLLHFSKEDLNYENIDEHHKRFH